jgi:hypothetical protein
MQFPKVNIPKKYIKIGAWVLGILVLIIFVIGFIAFGKREALLKKMIANGIQKADQGYGLEIKIGSANFSGLSTVHLTIFLWSLKIGIPYR